MFPCFSTNIPSPPPGGDFIHMLALALRLKLEEVTINWQYIQWNHTCRIEFRSFQYMYLCCSASATPSSWSRLLFKTLSSIPRTPLLTKRTRQSSSNGSLSSSSGIWLLSSNKAALLRARFCGHFLFQPNVVAMFVYDKALLNGQLFPLKDKGCDVSKFKNSLNIEHVESAIERSSMASSRVNKFEIPCYKENSKMKKASLKIFLIFEMANFSCNISFSVARDPWASGGEGGGGRVVYSGFQVTGVIEWFSWV